VRVAINNKRNNTFTKLYLASRDSLNRIVASIVPPHEIEDVVQETYVRICQAKNAEKISSKKSFMFTTAKNLALDYQKRAGTRLVDNKVDWDELEQLIENKHNDPVLNDVITNDEFSKFCEAIRQLPSQCRKVFVLKKVYGYTQKEIAKNMNISESTVEKHISSGTKRCMLMVQQDDLISNKSDVIQLKNNGTRG
jgi:RNA polymerase sigma-70 factor (ECF subfamily)